VGGVFSYGSYPDVDALYQQQAGELERRSFAGMRRLCGVAFPDPA